ncbi:MAG TPA: CRISPR-associated protein Csx3 [Roseiflexaceae bacterium]|nr:CRISPR-associated protein Csx3 [Roseiflexaceae bacterium]
MKPVFPAILICGPPHSGKSTLVYYLSALLRRRDIPHYALRASPDGDGDWSVRLPDALVAELRPHVRSEWSPAFATAVANDIARRHLPLLVDAGGKPSPETEQIAACCTHAIVLTADPSAAIGWEELARRHRLTLLATLESSLTTAQHISNPGPPLQGVLNGLHRDGDPAGPCMDLLLDRIAACCTWSSDELFQIHRALTTIDLVLHVERAFPPLPAHHAVQWQPAELPLLIATLPPEEPLAIYGRGPTWLYAALAVLAAPAPCQVFDVRQGWVAPPFLMLGYHFEGQTLRWSLDIGSNVTRITFSIAGGYLDYRDAPGMCAPYIDPNHGVILSGKLPNWLWTALACLYSPAAWVACYQPQIMAAVVIVSRTAAVPVGMQLPLELSPEI